MTLQTTTDLKTRTGFAMHVRSAHPGDEDLLKDFYENVTQEDLRFRFLSSFEHIPESEIFRMTHTDHRQTEDLIAFAPDGSEIIANAMIAGDKAMETAEVAISIHDKYKGKGIGWTLLDHVARYAKENGFKKLQSIEDRHNHSAINLEQEMGFTARSLEDDPSLVVLEVNLA